MKLLIDTADISAIKEAYEYLPIIGVTCNPTILSREHGDPVAILKEIRDFIKDDKLFVQVVGTTAEGMIEDGKAIADAFGKDTYIKIPAIKEGYKAMKQLHQEGYRTTATAIYYPQQALLSANAGVDYIAPYFNRIFKQGLDVIETIATMQKILKDTSTQILGASFKTVDQVIGFACLQPEAITLAPDVLRQLLDNPLIDEVAEKFNEDFYQMVGSRSSMKDVLKS